MQKKIFYILILSCTLFSCEKLKFHKRSISGIVYDLGLYEPLKNISVQILEFDIKTYQANSIASSVSNENGRFEFHDLKINKNKSYKIVWYDARGTYDNVIKCNEQSINENDFYTLEINPSFCGGFLKINEDEYDLIDSLQFTCLKESTKSKFICSDAKFIRDTVGDDNKFQFYTTEEIIHAPNFQDLTKYSKVQRISRFHTGKFNVSVKYYSSNSWHYIDTTVVIKPEEYVFIEINP